MGALPLCSVVAIVHGCIVHGCIVHGCIVHGCIVHGCIVHGCIVHGCIVHGCIVHCAVLFILRSGLNRVQVVLSGFSVRLFSFVQAKSLCMYGGMYFLAELVLVCAEIMVMSSA